MGLKRSKKGWETVAHKYRNDMRQLSTLDQPFYVYHGTLKKMIPVFFRRYASIEDKIERPDTTSTIGCGSDVHRCYGTIGIIKTPKCDKAGIEQFLMEESAGLKDSHWSWCDIGTGTLLRQVQLPEVVMLTSFRLALGNE